MNYLAVAAMLSFLAAPVWADPPVGNDDYPPEALSRHERGIVLVDLNVGTAGRVTHCRVLVSPNSDVLAHATCELFVTRARFSPAQDRHGNPKETHVRGMINWVIPGCPAPPQESPYFDDPVAASGTITSLQHC